MVLKCSQPFINGFFTGESEAARRAKIDPAPVRGCNGGLRTSLVVGEVLGVW